MNTRPAGDGSAPRITMQAGGGFVVTWASSACVRRLGRRYDGAGVSVEPEFVVDACPPLG